MYVQKKKRFRLELEGLRAVAAILVAVYHIWFNRISGGVDVFFVVSGFLITTSILSVYAKQKKLNIIAYVVKLLKRLMPTAWFVAIITMVLSIFILPMTNRAATVQEFVASLLYFENWKLAFSSVDYLAENNSASPFQQFWALGIQFQFYLIWLVLFTLVIFIYHAFRARNIKKVAALIITLTVIASFSFSVYFTSVNQPFAYYHTFTRLWEFGVGGLLALVAANITVHKNVAFVFGWAGLLGLIACGIIFQVGNVFPGFAALWPVMCAVLIVLAGDSAKKGSAYAVLSFKPLVKFGGISYAFYLWHWPILVFYYALFDVEQVSVLAGLGILVLSAVLAYITINFIEKPIRTMDVKTMPAFITIAALMTIALLGNFYWQHKEQERIAQVAAETERILQEKEEARKKAAIKEQRELEKKFKDWDISFNNPGAMVKFLDEPMYTSDETITPAVDVAKQDVSPVYPDKCITKINETNVVICEYGDTKNYEHVVAIIGGSHSAHWVPMLNKFGKKEKVKIVTYIKPRCRLQFNSPEDKGHCAPWFDDAIEQVIKDKPDLLFSVADIGKQQLPTIPEDFNKAWEHLDKHDIPLFLIRDNVWFGYNIVECVEENAGDPTKCKKPRNEAIAEPSPMSLQTNIPDNITYMDVTDYYCDEEYCYPVVGNMITHFDSNHFTSTFSETFAPIIGPEIKAVLEKNKQVKRDLPKR